MGGDDDGKKHLSINEEEEPAEVYTSPKTSKESKETGEDT